MKNQYEHLDSMKCGNAGIVHIPYEEGHSGYTWW